jgi:hypothetical protein
MYWLATASWDVADMTGYGRIERPALGQMPPEKVKDSRNGCMEGIVTGGVPVAVNEFRAVNWRSILEELIGNISGTVKLIGLTGNESNTVIGQSREKSPTLPSI